VGIANKGAGPAAGEGGEEGGPAGEERARGPARRSLPQTLPARGAARRPPLSPPAAGDPVISPAQFSRFLPNITRWVYRVDRQHYQWFAARKTRQRQKQRVRRLGGGPRELRGVSPLRLPVLPPTHPLIVAWGAAMLLADLTYTAILLPLAFAFGLHAVPAYRAASVTLGLMFTADMAVMLHRRGTRAAAEGVLSRGGGRRGPRP
jgi:hypothetical protein